MASITIAPPHTRLDNQGLLQLLATFLEIWRQGSWILSSARSEESIPNFRTVFFIVVYIWGLCRGLIYVTGQIIFGVVTIETESTRRIRNPYAVTKAGHGASGNLSSW